MQHTLIIETLSIKDKGYNKRVGTIYKNIARFIGSKLFFWLTIISFSLQAGWIAISARYPMAFDEAFHLGIIKIHAEQLSPIITQQPPGMAPYGALTTDPSYLFHWLMSLPYNLVTNHMSQFMSQIVTLRLINVAMFAFGLVLFRMVLAKTKASSASINIAMLFFTLTPVVTLLAAHINYDNLLMPCVAGTLLLTLRFRERLIDKHQFDSRSLAGVIILSLLASLVKFPFLPILTGVVVYLIYLLFSLSRRGRKSLHLIKSAKKDWAGVPKWQKLALCIGLVISIGLFSYSYVTNIIVYHNPVPQCGQVVGIERCQAYGPWARNHRLAQNIPNDPNIFYFIPNWIGGMFQRLFFVINSASGPAVYQNFIAPIMAGTAVLGGSIGLFLFFKRARDNLNRDRALTVTLFIMLIYVAALWGRNYHDYLQLGAMVAINGRYMVLIALPFYLVALIGWQHWLAGRIRLKLAVFMVATLLFLQGGGIVSYIAYSNKDWYWPQNTWVQAANKSLQKIVKPLVWAPKIR